MDDTGVDTTAPDVTMADDKGRISTAKTPAKETAKAKEPKTPRGKGKKEEAKEEEEDKKEEEIVSRSGRKIRPKRYIDEQTEENTTLPSPAPMKRRAASPQQEEKKEKEKSEPKGKVPGKNMKYFNTVTQSEFEDIKEPFKADINKIKLITNEGDKDIVNTNNKRNLSVEKSKSTKSVAKRKKFVPPTKKSKENPVNTETKNECLSQTCHDLRNGVNLNLHMSPAPNIQEESKAIFHNSYDNQHYYTTKDNKGIGDIQNNIMQEYEYSNTSSQTYYDTCEKEINHFQIYQSDRVKNLTKTKITDGKFDNRTKKDTLGNALLNSLTILNDDDDLIFTQENIENNSPIELETKSLKDLQLIRNFSTNSVTSLNKTYKNLDASSIENRTNLHKNVPIISGKHNPSPKIPVGDEFLKLFQCNRNISDYTNNICIVANISNDITETSTEVMAATKSTNKKTNNAITTSKEATNYVATTIHGDIGFNFFYSDFIKNSGISEDNEDDEVKYNLLNIKEMYPSENEILINMK